MKFKKRQDEARELKEANRPIKRTTFKIHVYYPINK